LSKQKGLGFISSSVRYWFALKESHLFFLKDSEVWDCLCFAMRKP